jgi:hypothetical protein
MFNSDPSLKIRRVRYLKILNSWEDISEQIRSIAKIKSEELRSIAKVKSEQLTC